MKVRAAWVVVAVAWAVGASACRGDGEGGEVAALAAAAQACPFKDGYALDCGPYAAFLAGLDRRADDAALVALVESPDPRRRWLGATGLVRRGEAYARDGGLRGRLLVAARGEVDPAAASAIGAALCRAQNRPATAEPAGDAAAERAQVEALAAEHPLPAMRAALLGELLGYGGPSWFEFTELRLGNDADGEVRRAALSAFMTADPARKDEVCGLWKRHADADPDPATAAVAARSLASWGHCR